MRVVFEVTEGPGQGRKFQFDRHDVFLVGRSGRCHFCIGDDMRYSRIHLMIEVTPTICRMAAMGRNATYVNDVKVTECDLTDGAIIRAGATVMSVEIIRDIIPVFGQRAVLEEPDDSTPFETRRGDSVSINVDPGDRIPGYQFATKLTVGGMGIIWLAEDAVSGRKVIIKTLRPEFAVNAEARQLFLREQKHSNALRHPNIVDFIEVGEHQNELFIVMEYVPGFDAYELCQRQGGRLSVSDAVEIGVQSLNALGYAHQQNVVHRDIKPPNILVTGRSSADFQVKVADFGLAKHFRSSGMTSMTQTGQVRGSVPFMPPEQVTNCKGVDHLADIFSLGATLYTLLTGEFVYPFKPTEDKYVTVTTGKIVPLEDRGVPLPNSLCMVINRSLSRDPKKRYQSAREMSTALQAVK